MNYPQAIEAAWRIASTQPPRFHSQALARAFEEFRAMGVDRLRAEQARAPRDLVPLVRQLLKGSFS